LLLVDEEFMASKGFEHLHVYQLVEKLADAIWDLVIGWNDFAKATVGNQMVRAADSIGANIAEGTGRGTFKDNKNFARIGRGSLNETRHFLRRAYRRNLLTKEQIGQLTPIIQELGPRLNAYIKSIGPRPDNPSQTITSDK
jgi:four helix bundle protein